MLSQLQHYQDNFSKWSIYGEKRPPWMTTLGQYMLYGILYNTTMLWLCHFRPTACVLFSKCSQMAKFGPKCSKWPKMGHKWPIIGQNMAHLYFLTCLSHIWPESSAKSCIMYVFSWPPCALPKLTTVYHHNKTHHQNETKNVSCGICDRSFFTQRDLKVHIKDKHGGHFFQCSECEEVF